MKRRWEVLRDSGAVYWIGASLVALMVALATYPQDVVPVGVQTGGGRPGYAPGGFARVAKEEGEPHPVGHGFLATSVIFGAFGVYALRSED